MEHETLLGLWTPNLSHLLSILNISLGLPYHDFVMLIARYVNDWLCFIVPFANIPSILQISAWYSCIVEITFATVTLGML